MFIFGIALWMVSVPILATTTQISTQIFDIDYAKDGQKETLILLNSGLVAKVPAGKSTILNQLSEHKSKDQTYKFTLDEKRFIVAVEPTERVSLIPANARRSNTEKFTYIPTTIASMDIVKKYHKEARYNPKDSQCFNRAMVWTYEWWKNHSLKSNKILIYFSRTYIRRYNFEWWFHIAPYVHVMDNGKVVERVLDVKYTNGPRTFKQWTDIFVNKDPVCPVITKFSDYADYPYTGDCFIQRTNMYTYQPADLQMHEAWNYTKTNFLLQEVKQAYEEAFDETFSTNAGE